MAESFKNHGKKVFVIFADGVHTGEILKTQTNNRGVVSSFRVRLRGIETHEVDRISIPVTVTIQKTHVFNDEEVADKALFVYKLKGE